MRRHGYAAVLALSGLFALPVLSGCDGGNQQVRDEVLEIESSDGENIQIRDSEVRDDVNVDVQRPE